MTLWRTRPSQASTKADAGRYRIPLPPPHDSLKAVNVDAGRDGDGLVPVESGWALTEARDRLDKR